MTRAGVPGVAGQDGDDLLDQRLGPALPNPDCLPGHKDQAQLILSL